MKTRLSFRRSLLLLVLLLAPAVPGRAGAAQLLAKVDVVRWSPFVRGPLPPAGGRVTDLLGEARRLISTDPGRMVQILARESLPPGRASTFARGLRADALYLLGGEHLAEAQAGYRAVVTQDAGPDEQAWAEFMLGNLLKVRGFSREAGVALRGSLRGEAAARPWRAAALFDLGALELEAGRPADARVALEAWLRDFGVSGPGRASVLSLLAESLAAGGQGEQALARFAEAQTLDPKAWLARPPTGEAVAALLRRRGEPAQAARLLEMIPKAYPGTLEGARARLAVGEIWEEAGQPALAVRSYGLLLDEGPTPAEGRAATLRLALLGAEHGPGLRLVEHHPAYRVYFRPVPVLEEASRGGDPNLARRALRALGLVYRREGKPEEALAHFARGFQGAAEGPEAAKAYDAYVDALEATLAEKLQAGAFVDVIETYEASKPAAAWTSARDLGRAALVVAQAYRSLGAPSLAREIYDDLRRRGSRAVPPAELEARVAEAAAEAGDYAALAALAGRRPADWKLQRALARALAAQGRPAEARDHYAKAAELAPQAADRLTLLAEGDRLLEASGRVDDVLASLRKRKALWESLPQGPEREAWAQAGTLTEARLRFSKKDYAGAAEAFNKVKLFPEDVYLLAVSEKHVGRVKRARELFESLSGGADATLSSLAQFQLQSLSTDASVRGSR